MPSLYTCKSNISHEGQTFYRITKLDPDDNVESTYTCTFDTCECPAGKRPTCRHREMLPRFVARGAINTGWRYDFDRGGWVDYRTEEELARPLEDAEVEESFPETRQTFTIPEGHEAVRDAEGRATGEVRLTAPTEQPKSPWRRF